MVSKTKRGTAFKAVFDDYVNLVKEFEGVEAVAATEWPGPEIVTFVDEVREELSEKLSDAKVAVLNAHSDIDPEFHTNGLYGASLTDFDLAACDLLYSRANGK